MYTAQLLEAVRTSAYISSAHPVYTDARLCQELWDALNTVFVKPVVEMRAGFWLQQTTQATVAAQQNVRIPFRACVGGLEKLEISDSGGTNFRSMVGLSMKQTPRYENQSGRPQRYNIVDDQVMLYPTPDSAGYLLRFTYYVKPSQIVADQVATPKGRITTVTPATRQIVVNAVPDNKVTSVPVATTDLIDVVHANGLHGLGIVGLTQTFTAPNIYTLPVGTDMTRIYVGDYVRAAEQSDFPCLPDEYHRTLADVTAAIVLASIGDSEKAQILAGKAQNDVDRFIAAATPRVKDEPKIIKPTYGVTRRGSRFTYPIAP